MRIANTIIELVKLVVLGNYQPPRWIFSPLNHFHNKLNMEAELWWTLEINWRKSGIHGASDCNWMHVICIMVRFLLEECLFARQNIIVFVKCFSKEDKKKIMWKSLSVWHIWTLVNLITNERIFFWRTVMFFFFLWRKGLFWPKYYNF
jgi:hypothetical protein